MARANTTTWLSLDRYAEIMGIDPRHFNQVVCMAFPVTDVCPDLWLQYAWQHGDRTSREDLARAIQQAERMIAQYLGWAPYPAWIEDERARYPKQVWRIGPSASISVRQSLRGPTRKKIVSRWARVIAGGRKNWTLLDDALAPVYSDPYGVGFDDVATVTATIASTVTGLQPKEVRMVPAGTPAGDLERLAIRGLRGTLTGNTLVMTGLSCRFVDPNLWEQDMAIDGDAAASFLASVDVYRLWNSSDGDANAPAIFGSEIACLGDDALACGYGSSYGCLLVANPEQGIVAPVPAQWEATGWTKTCLPAEPDVVRMWYYAGHPSDELGEMAPPLDRAVAALATTLLAKPICGCQRAEQLADYWRNVPDNATFEQLNCPFGPASGAWTAYQVVRQFVTLAGSIV